jgi:hypothetical protein
VPVGKIEIVEILEKMHINGGSLLSLLSKWEVGGLSRFQNIQFILP